MLVGRNGILLDSDGFLYKEDHNFVKNIGLISTESKRHRVTGSTFGDLESAYRVMPANFMTSIKTLQSHREIHQILCSMSSAFLYQ